MQVLLAGLQCKLYDWQSFDKILHHDADHFFGHKTVTHCIQMYPICCKYAPFCISWIVCFQIVKEILPEIY